jgi:ribosomal protein L30/L7E
MHQSALVQDTPQNRGMIERAKHMLKVEDVK